ncbi:MAG: response regulator [Planctomycetes bacterium]|nr:response regulator [Planctomycetota bacterium]MBI3832774.1 response regulator [Planctomycetota bacterium]
MARILVADDDAFIVRIMSIWLTRHGHEVVCVQDGQQAFDQVQLGNIDVAISDMNMPVMDGAEFVRQVREKLKLKLPIIVLSARCDRDRLSEMLAEYDVRIYPKPFLPSQIVSEINQMVAHVASPRSL